MKLWDKGFSIVKEIEEFTVGKDRNLDLLLSKYDVLGSIAHAKMLESVGLLSNKEFEQIHTVLKQIYQHIEQGDFRIEEGVEDVHSQIERNDQVLVDIRLFVRDQIRQIVTETLRLFDQLLSLSEQYKEVFLPGYTHMQLAMPSSFGLWFAAYAESLVDDVIMLYAAYQIINKNPLGSAAGYGSSLPINRQLTTELLGFDSMNYNVVYAQMGRGKTEKVVSYALSLVASTLAKFRAKCNKLQTLPNEISIITANLPSGYHRDLQVLKENFLPAFSDLQQCLRITCFMLKHIKVNKEIKNNDIYQHLFSVEAVNQLVMQGMPFRTAYQKVAKDIQQGGFNTIHS